jgi:hypothetical protein
MNIGRLVRREIAQGGRVPRGWRVAWYEPKRRIAVYSPILLHWVQRFGHELAFRVHKAMAARTVEQEEIAEMQRNLGERQRLAEEYSRGYLNGWRDCMDGCLAVVEEEFARTSQFGEMGEMLWGYSAEQSN